MGIYHFPEKNVLRNYRSPFTELNISEIGLHDLRNIPPLLYTRKQDYFTLHFILNGRGTLFIDDKKYDLQENDMFFISPYQTHKYYAVPPIRGNIFGLSLRAVLWETT
ncbi:MAG: AraC family ligand binding domain-containing protein [Christensenellaceae bacterium]